MLEGGRDQLWVMNKKKDLLSIFLNRHLKVHVRFHEFTEKHELDETHAERDFCLTTISNHISHFHLKLMSAAIKKYCVNQPRTEEVLSTMTSKSEVFAAESIDDLS